ncbi:MFS transporter [Thalassotalea sp. PS06]|uniref:MFS transporter n=1 Tax=Thalassotalea sp. PS06 TaxID=2594005 RepID=UPI0011651C55|nr:MFS transporter [Thalassotalea sp. PS06]QDP02613.1 multidrug effflux MFS transporter [Thalassotalea sp. PS06]
MESIVSWINPTLLVVSLAMMAGVWVLNNVYRYPRNIWVLVVSQPLLLCISPTMTFISGILAREIAPDATLATLPLTMMIVGLAASTLLAARLSALSGRKKATNMGYAIALIGALLATFAAKYQNFYVLIAASICFGSSLAFSQQLRFAALESVSEKEGPRVISTLMLSGIAAAMIGPEVALMSKDWLPSQGTYVGSFVALACLIIASMAIFQWFSNPKIAQVETHDSPGRPLNEIVKQPVFIIAVCSAAIGYGVMSLLMTATPLSMHGVHGHSLDDTKWVIQSHIAAMFLPSLITGSLIKRFGAANILIAGSIVMFLVLVIALGGHQVVHYWWALVLLGIGWNFLFITGTVILPQSYQHNERFKVQAVNDFTIFTVQALGSLLAGYLLFSSNWNTLIMIASPFVAIMLVISIIQYRRERSYPMGSESITKIK